MRVKATECPRPSMPVFVSRGLFLVSSNRPGRDTGRHQNVPVRMLDVKERSRAGLIQCRTTRSARIRIRVAEACRDYLHGDASLNTLADVAAQSIRQEPLRVRNADLNGRKVSGRNV